MSPRIVPKRKKGVEGFLAAVTSAITREGIVRSAVRRAQPQEKARLLREAGSLCESCAVALPDPEMLHIHHVVPVKRGGTNAIGNTALLCPNCHAIAHWLDRTGEASSRPSHRDDLLLALVAIRAPVREAP